jgi:hypothetical protein
MRKLLRAALEKSLPPRAFAAIMAARARSHQAKYMQQVGMSSLAQQFSATCGLTVRYGPFRGLQYTPEAAQNRLLICKLLGTYEQELHPIIDALAPDSYDCIVDVGSAEGYYAIGLALKTQAAVFAFDAASAELALARQMAEHNGVADRVRLESWCDADTLVKLAAKHRRCFIVSDCEGYETELFTEQTIPALKTSDLLIELHGAAKDVLVPRLQHTHNIHLIAAIARTDGNFAELEPFSPEQRRAAVNEYRGQQYWLWAPAKLP